MEPLKHLHLLGPQEFNLLEADLVYLNTRNGCARTFISKEQRLDALCVNGRCAFVMYKCESEVSPGSMSVCYETTTLEREVECNR